MTGNEPLILISTEDWSGPRLSMPIIRHRLRPSRQGSDFVDLHPTVLRSETWRLEDIGAPNRNRSNTSPYSLQLHLLYKSLRTGRRSPIRHHIACGRRRQATAGGIWLGGARHLRPYSEPGSGRLRHYFPSRADYPEYSLPDR